MNFFVNMHQTSARMQRQCKTAIVYGLWRLGFKQWGQHAPFYRLRHVLMGWQQCKHMQQDTATLTVQDIGNIRQMLERAQQSAQVNLPPALLDQWFFLALGAMQQRTPAASQQAWQLFDQSVHAQLAPGRVYHAWLSGLLVSLCVAWMVLVPLKRTTVIEPQTPLETESYNKAGTADPVTLSLLNLAYQKMKNGSCQLPQAAMLPEQQRQAFILFVTEGKVDTQQVEPLRQALGYVSCLYPQELMRPQGNQLPRE